MTSRPAEISFCAPSYANEAAVIDQNALLVSVACLALFFLLPAIARTGALARRGPVHVLLVLLAGAFFLVGLSAGSVQLTAALALLPLLVQSLTLLLRFLRPAMWSEADRDSRCGAFSLAIGCSLIVTGFALLIASDTTRFTCFFAVTLSDRLRTDGGIIALSLLGGLLVLSLIVIRASEHLLFSAHAKESQPWLSKMKAALGGFIGSFASIRFRGPWLLSVVAEPQPIFLWGSKEEPGPLLMPSAPFIPLPSVAASTIQHQNGGKETLAKERRHARSESLPLLSPRPQNSAYRPAEGQRRAASDTAVSDQHLLEGRREEESKGGVTKDDEHGAGGVGIFSRALKRVRQEAGKREEHKLVAAAVLKNAVELQELQEKGTEVSRESDQTQAGEAISVPSPPLPPRAYLRFFSRLHPLAYSVAAATSLTLFLLFLKVVLEGLKAVTYGASVNRKTSGDAAFDVASHVGLFLVSSLLALLFGGISQRLLVNGLRFFDSVFVLPVFAPLLVTGAVVAGGFIFSSALQFDDKATTLLLCSAALLMLGALLAADNACFLLVVEREMQMQQAEPPATATADGEALRSAGRSQIGRQSSRGKETARSEGRASAFQLLSFSSSEGPAVGPSATSASGGRKSPLLTPRRTHFLRREWGTKGVCETPAPIPIVAQTTVV